MYLYTIRLSVIGVEYYLNNIPFIAFSHILYNYYATSL